MRSLTSTLSYLETSKCRDICSSCKEIPSCEVLFNVELLGCEVCVEVCGVFSVELLGCEGGVEFCRVLEEADICNTRKQKRNKTKSCIGNGMHRSRASAQYYVHCSMPPYQKRLHHCMDHNKQMESAARAKGI